MIISDHTLVLYVIIFSLFFLVQGEVEVVPVSPPALQPAAETTISSQVAATVTANARLLY